MGVGDGPYELDRVVTVGALKEKGGRQEEAIIYESEPKLRLIIFRF